MFEIRYTAQPIDVRTGYWQSWYMFPSYRIRIIGMGIITALAFGILTLTLFRSIMTSVLIGIIIAVIYPAILSILIGITTKKSQRQMIIGATGISTTIGKSHGELTWDRYARVFATDTHIIIVGKNLNLFTIPNRAYKSSEEKSKCLEAMQSYIAASCKT